MQLVRYEQARHALAEAHRVDEVKDIRDKAEAMAAYARQAKDTELIQYATEIKVRAERRCGELLSKVERAKAGENQFTRSSHDSTTSPTLSDIGITKDQSSRYQQLAAMPDEHFETAVATAKHSAGEVTTAFMLREAKKRSKKKPQREARKAASVVMMPGAFSTTVLHFLRALAEDMEARGLSGAAAAALFTADIASVGGCEEPLQMFCEIAAWSAGRPNVVQIPKG